MICPKTKSATHCLTKLFPIYQNKHWTIRQQDDRSVHPSSRRIILKIVGFQGSLETRICRFVWSFLLLFDPDFSRYCSHISVVKPQDVWNILMRFQRQFEPKVYPLGIILFTLPSQELGSQFNLFLLCFEIALCLQYAQTCTWT